MENVVIKPLGRVLERAGLISDFQIRQALEIQSKNHRLKFGTILVSHGILKQKTVDFFAERLPKLQQHAKRQPLGYYLQEAALIDSSQIESLLEHQKQTGMLLGELIVEKGLMTQKTLDFFLQYLAEIENNQKLLSPSYQGIIQSLHLETKVASPYSLFREIFDWTGGHPLLTRQLCKIISNSDVFIPSGLEAVLVKILVEKQVIYNWEEQIFGEYLKTIQAHLLNNTVCLPKTLLDLYLKILQHEEFNPNLSREKQELIKLGLVIERENKLKVANRIYREVFNSDWVKEQLSALEKKSHTFERARKERISNIWMATKRDNEPFTKIAALTILSGLFLFSPLVFFLNNSQHKLWQENERLNFQSLSKSAFCTETIPTDLAERKIWQRTLEEERQSLREQFPDDCQNNLDRLTVLNAIQLGTENRVLDGVYALCQIDAASQSFEQARFWLARWYDSEHWGDLTQSYLSSIGNCPIAENLAVN